MLAEVWHCAAWPQKFRIGSVNALYLQTGSYGLDINADFIEEYAWLIDWWFQCRIDSITKHQESTWILWDTPAKKDAPSNIAYIYEYICEDRYWPSVHTALAGYKPGKPGLWSLDIQAADSDLRLSDLQPSPALYRQKPRKTATCRGPISLNRSLLLSSKESRYTE
jgi:hypothetical protein